MLPNTGFLSSAGKALRALGLNLLTVVSMFGCSSDKDSLSGPYAFTATGDLVGTFSGIATAEYTHPLSGAGHYYNIVLPVTTELFDSVPNRGMWLQFIRDQKPGAGAFSLNNDKAAGAAQDQRFEVILAGRTDHRSIVWQGVDGELRIEKDEKKGSLTGKFWAKFTKRDGDSTKTMQVTGQFDAR
ncbi:MAG: hypothetical protein ABIT20_00450 [Gemmatimonadaceae bacterium]